MTTTTITVDGMTCGHCAGAVTEELQRLEGVTAVQVELESGEVTIEHSEPLEPTAIAAAIDEAGYELRS